MERDVLDFASTVRPGTVALLAVSAVLAGCSRPGSPIGERAVPHYDPASGRLQRLTFDSTSNGRHDAVGIMDGVRVERIDVDENEDGTIDRWEFYDANRHLEKVGFSRQRNGIMDAVAVYAKGAVERVEISTESDGRFNRVEFYRAGLLARVEEDTNGDGRVDKWETYGVDPRATPGQPSLVTAAFDDHSRGTPNRRLRYDWDGRIVRAEIDPEGDGTFSAWGAGQRQ